MSTGDPAPFPSDEQNPYAPPRVDVGAELVLSDLTPMAFSLGDVLSRTWEIYRDRMGFCIGLVVIWYILYIGAVIGLQVTIGIAPQARNPYLIQALGYAVYTVFMVWISIGQNMVLLDVARGRDASIGGLFGGGHAMLKMLLGGTLFFLLMIGAFALGAAPGGLIWAAVGSDSPIGAIAFGLGCFAGSVGAVFLGLRLSQFSFLIIDRDAGIAESFRLSRQVTRGKAGMIFLLYMLTGALNMAGFLTLCVGIIFTAPYCLLLLVVTYLALTGQPTADPNAKGEPYAELEPL